MSDDSKIRLLLLDDHEIVRNGIAAVLETESDIDVVASAASAEEALPLYREHRPDVAIVDLRLPGMGGAEFIETLRDEFPESRFVVLTTFDSDEDIYQAVRAGAQSYLLKDSFQSEILSAIRRVHAGELVIPPDISSKLRGASKAIRLSPREIEVLEYVAKGESNKAIAATLGLSDGTIKSHLLRIYTKLGVDDRTAAVTTAVSRGLLKL